MYKKLLALAAFVALALCLTGCVKNTTNIEITKKDEVILTRIDAIDKELIKAAIPEFTAEGALAQWNEDKLIKDEREKLTKRDYYFSDYNENNYIGTQYKKTFKKPNYVMSEDLPEGFLMSSGAKEPIEVKKSPFGTKYSIHLVFDVNQLRKQNDKKMSMQTKKSKNAIEAFLNPNNNTDNATENKSANSIQNEPKNKEYKPSMELVIKIPKKAKEHNATEVNNVTHEYKWVLSDTEELKKGKPVEIVLKYQKTNIFSILFLIFIIIWTISVIIKNEKYAKKDTDETDEAF